MKTIVTHDGKFHADDVFAVAVLFSLYPDARIVRTRDGDRIREGDIVVDVGGVDDDVHDRFDHHQIGGAGVRANSIPYASFGLVWKKFGEALSGNKEVAERVEEVLVASIDASDNGIDLMSQNISGLSSYEIGDMVRAFIPTWLEDVDMDAAFREVVSIAKRIIEREIRRAEAVLAGQQKVRDAYHAASDKRLIILDEDFSWKETLARFLEPLYVVHPQNGTWRLYCVRDNPHEFKNRKDLPAAWAGLRDEALVKVTGVPDTVFCHRNRFMAVARSREGVLALAHLALK